MSLQESGYKAITWSLTEKLLKRGIQFVLSIFLARLLTPDDFGVVAMATIFVSWSEVFKDFGMGQALVQKKNVTEEQVSTVFFINIIMGLLIALILVIIAPFAAKFYNNDMVAWCVRASALTFVITSFNIVQSSLFTKNLNFKVGTLASAYASALSGAVGIFCAYSGLGIWSLLIQSVLSSVITTIVIWTKSNWRPKFHFNFNATYPLFRKGVGYMGKGFVDNVFSALDSMVIGKLFSASALGLYNRGKGLYDMVDSTIVLPVTRPLFPILAKVQDNKELLTSYYVRIMNMLNWCLIFCAGIFLIESKELIHILYGEQWVVSAKYLWWLALLLPFYANSCLSSSAFRAQGRVKILLVLSTIERTLFFLSLFALLIGLDFYVVVFVSVSIVLRLVESIIYVKLLDISFLKQNGEMMKGILIIAFPVVLFYFYEMDNVYVSFAIKTLSFTIYYVCISWLLKQQGMKDIYELAKKRIKR